MKRINSTNINTIKYWDEHIAEPDFGLRQEKYLELAGRGKNILEVGCGLSPFLDRAREQFLHCSGIDFSPKTVEAARKKYPKVGYMLGDATDIPFSNYSQEVTVAGELIEHLEHPGDLILELVRVTRKRVIISTARMEYNDPEHLWQFTKKDLLELGKPFGKAKVEEIKSDWFPGRSYLFLTIDLKTLPDRDF